jgi:hypothetical protein
VAEEKKTEGNGRRRRRTPEEQSKKYTDLPPGEHAGVGGTHGTIKIPDSGTYETSDPVEQGFIESVLGGTSK